MKIAIVTSICGDKEDLSNPSVIHPGVDYFAFVDKKNSLADTWTQLDPSHFSSDRRFANRRNAKIYKILPELFIPGYDYYFWVDASHDVVADPFKTVVQYTSDSAPFAVFRHNERNCIYEESKLLMKLKYDHKYLIKQQISYYKSRCYPKKNGLYELSAFIKKRTPLSTTASLRWWDYICRFSSRDQISFPFVLWEFDIEPMILPGEVNGYNNEGTLGNNPFMPQIRYHYSSGV